MTTILTAYITGVLVMLGFMIARWDSATRNLEVKDIVLLLVGSWISIGFIAGVATEPDDEMEDYPSGN